MPDTKSTAGGQGEWKYVSDGREGWTEGTRATGTSYITMIRSIICADDLRTTEL